ncbi:glutathione s-transferase [Musa troglodytarum]|uniref:glutathione transferase n=2 Tax=Musa troglodytarum TaxID=320322 RepID=A0A9E7GKY3_9LILI|nr:glutathione s-transferase [Musa troglodytarum]
MAATVPPVAQVYFGKPMLPDVSRVLACLYEKEIAFELVDMYEGHRMPADILKLQATMRAPVPAFKDRDTFLVESRAICRYVSEKYAEHGNKYLLGRDLLDRGSIEQWLKTEEQSFDPPSWALVFHLAFAPLTNGNELDQSPVTESEKKLGRVLDVYEHRLRESKYLAGDEFTLADLSHLPNTHYLVNSGQWNHLFNSRKNVQRWWEKISNRPSWTKVVEMLNKVETPKKSSAAEEVATAREAKMSRLSQTPAAATASQTSPPSTPVVPQSTPEVKTSPQTAATPSRTIPQSTPEVKTSPQAVPTASQTSPGTAAPEPISKPSLEQKSSADKPDSAIDQQSSPKGAASKPISQSEPATQPTPQSQGDSSTGKPTSATTRSNQKTDAPIDNSAPKGTSETKATSQPDSTASSTASDKPNSQPSGDKPAS